jgi:hypothetical protein
MNSGFFNLSEFLRECQQEFEQGGRVTPVSRLALQNIFGYAKQCASGLSLTLLYISSVIPAEAGIQNALKILDSGLRFAYRE